MATMLLYLNATNTAWFLSENATGEVCLYARRGKSKRAAGLL